MPSESGPHELVPDDADSLARRLVLIPATICVLQAIALLVIGGLALADPGQGVAGAAVEAIVLALLAVGLVTVAVGLLRFRAWARSPLMALQLIALLTALAFAGLDTLLGWVLALMSAASIAATLSSPVARAMEGEPPEGIDA